MSENETIYRCKRCLDCYARPQRGVMWSCGVAHPPNSCCHYGERKLSQEEAGALIELLDDPWDVWRLAVV